MSEFVSVIAVEPSDRSQPQVTLIILDDMMAFSCNPSRDEKFMNLARCADIQPGSNKTSKMLSSPVFIRLNLQTFWKVHSNKRIF